MTTSRMLVWVVLANVVSACNGGGTSDGGDAMDITVSDVTDARIDSGIDTAMDAPPDVLRRDVMMEAAAMCGTITDCMSCNATPGCGWCGSSSTCMAGTPAGALGGACPSGWTFFVAVCGGISDAGAGLTWTAQHLPVTGTVEALWGTSRGVYAAAEGGIFYSTGDGNWSMQFMVDTALSVWGSSATDLYAVATRPSGSVILHSDGSGTWTPQFMTDGRTDVTTITSIWGSQHNDVWAVGFLALPPRGVVLYSSGDGNWSIVQTLTTTTLRLVSIAGSGPNDIYAAGQPNALFHFDGATWSGPSVGFTDNPGVVWLADATDVYVGAAGGVWSSAGDDNWIEQIDPMLNFEPQALGGSSRNDVYAAGFIRGEPGGALFHSADGMTWTRVTVTSADPLSAVWANAPANVYVGGGSGLVLHGGT